MALEFQPFHYGKAEDPQQVDISKVIGSVVIGLGLLAFAAELFSTAQHKQFIIPSIYFFTGLVIFSVHKLKKLA
ncbi:MAG: hypothetical protein AABX51_04425 [Nanoarchaeota archaeon]